MSVEKILQNLRERKQFLFCAESLTGGLLTHTFSSVPGASDVLLGGIVAYDSLLKSELLGVSRSLIENQGPVDPEVAAQMATGVREKIANQRGLDLGSLVTVATTGNAGPDTQGGKPVGEVYIAISQGEVGEPSSKVFAHHLSGTRAEIQQAVVLLTLDHLWDEIAR